MGLAKELIGEDTLLILDPSDLKEKVLKEDGVPYKNT